MNMSDLITRIKLDMGIYAIALPFPNVDKMMADIIKKITLRVYSQYFPLEETVRKSSKEIQVYFTKRDYTDVKLDLAPGEEVIEIEDIYYDDTDLARMGYYGTTLPQFQYSNLQDLLMSNVSMNLSNLTIPKLTWDFNPPNSVRIYNLYTGSIFIKYLKLHDPSLASIPYSQEESFFKLAELDVKKVFFQMIKHYNELESAHGRINLKIDDWEQADSARADILREWDETFHLDRKTIYYA